MHFARRQAADGHWEIGGDWTEGNLSMSVGVCLVGIICKMFHSVFCNVSVYLGYKSLRISAGTRVPALYG